MSQRVLVVEDDVDAREALELLLSHCGYETETAGDGESAIDKATEFHPDILLCDWKLEGSQDGVATTRAIQMTQKIPVIFFTAHSVSELRAQTRDLDVHAYLSKPIDVRRLTSALAALS
jgi:CheY-like chemotaxis protein